MVGVGLGQVLALHGQLRQLSSKLGLLFFGDIERDGVIHREVRPSAPLTVDVRDAGVDSSYLLLSVRSERGKVSFEPFSDRLNGRNRHLDLTPQ
ncbi:hypothetical protein ACWFOS_20190 [Gordonia terrae]